MAGLTLGFLLGPGAHPSAGPRPAHHSRPSHPTALPLAAQLAQTIGEPVPQHLVLCPLHRSQVASHFPIFILLQPEQPFLIALDALQVQLHAVGVRRDAGQHLPIERLAVVRLLAHQVAPLRPELLLRGP